MPCFSPLKGYRSPDGRVRFSHPSAWVDRHVTVACGQCQGCRLERSRQWAVRCMHESQMHESNCFITLTYRDADVPNNGSLDLADWQNFAKRLRHTIGPFRFYHCGEYGDLEGRPHYHAAIFGTDFSSDRKPSRRTAHGHMLYESETLDGAWQKGFSQIGELTFQSAAYVARYIMKKALGKTAETHYERVIPDTGEVINLKPEYTTMSRRPGIGKTWFDQYVSDVYPHDYVISDGRRARPPKFYDSQYEILSPEGHDQVKRDRKRKGKKHQSNNTPERLKVREQVLNARLTQLERNL